MEWTRPGLWVTHGDKGISRRALCGVGGGAVGAAARRSSRGAKGFTLVELLIALALAMVLSGSIMFVAMQTQRIYAESVQKVELFSRLRYAFSLMENELASMVATCDLEYFVDSQGSATRSNRHWDPKEEIDSAVNLAGGWGAGSRPERFYNEAPEVIERKYIRTTKLGDEQELDAFEIYFRAPVTIAGKVRLANVEYRLVKAEDLVKISSEAVGVKGGSVQAFSEDVLPRVTRVDQNAELSLVRIVRYMDKGIDIFQRTNWKALMRSHISEIASNLQEFKIEYYARNPYSTRSTRGTSRGKAGWFTPSMEYGRGKAVELSTARVGSAGDYVYIKEFMYGTSRLQNAYSSSSSRPPRGIIRKAIKIDPRNPGGRAVPPQFYVETLKFAELSIGDQIFLWPDTSPNQPFAGGEYTIKNINNGRLTFLEPIDTSSWRNHKTGLRFKAAYLPMALRLSVVISDRRGMRSHRLSRIVRLTTKSSS